MGIEATDDTEAANSGFEGTIEAANKATDGHRQLATKEEVMELDLTFHIVLQSLNPKVPRTWSTAGPRAP